MLHPISEILTQNPCGNTLYLYNPEKNYIHRLQKFGDGAQCIWKKTGSMNLERGYRDFWKPEGGNQEISAAELKQKCCCITYKEMHEQLIGCTMNDAERLLWVMSRLDVSRSLTEERSTK